MESKPPPKLTPVVVLDETSRGANVAAVLFIRQRRAASATVGGHRAARP